MVFQIEAIFVCIKGVKNGICCHHTGYFKLKMHQNSKFGCGSAPDPAFPQKQRSPDPLGEFGEVIGQEKGER